MALTLIKLLLVICSFFVICDAGDRYILDSWYRFPRECKLTQGGQEYAGDLSTTRNGRTCQAWNQNTPQHNYYINSNVYPELNSTAAGNRCRNPDYNWNSASSGPWCYTTHPGTRWARCQVDFCECKLEEDGTDYQGLIQQTVGNLPCQRWNRQYPHQHPYNSADYFVESSVYYARNYCRNPNASRPLGPWCYTTDSSVEWQYCEIPLCNISFYYRPTTAGPETTMELTTELTTTPTTTTLSTTTTTTRPPTTTIIPITTTTTQPLTTTTPTRTSTTTPTTTTQTSRLPTTTTTPRSPTPSHDASSVKSTTSAAPSIPSETMKTSSVKPPEGDGPRGEDEKQLASTENQQSGLGVKVGVPVGITVGVLVLGIILYVKRQHIKSCFSGNKSDMAAKCMDNPVYYSSDDGGSKS